MEPTKKEMLAAEGIDPESGDQTDYHPKPVQPPPLYITANLPFPSAANQAAPDNLYTDHGTADSIGTITPAMPDNQRPHTPHMPNIEG